MMPPTPETPSLPKGLPREEWDFRALGKTPWYDVRQYHPFEFLEDDEVFYCNYYERERHGTDSDMIVESRQKLKDWPTWQMTINGQTALSTKDRELLAARTFDMLLDDHLRTSRDKVVIVNWFYVVWPEWPARPYLSIPRLERNRRFRACWGRNPARPLPLVPLRDLWDYLCALRANKEPRPYPWRQQGKKLKMNDDAWIIHPWREGDGNAKSEIAAFLIDFEMSNKTLLRLFSNWLTQRRQNKGYRQLETRGASSQTDRLRHELLVLGAARLIRSGMTSKQAMEYTQQLTGQPLYRHESAWSRAVSRAEDWLGQIR
jgi:hypothetical protein